MPDPIVEEEQRVLAAVTARLDATPVPAPPKETALVQELDHLRDSLREGAKTEDRAAIVQQWDRQSALLHHLRTAERPVEVDPGSPYFAHLRLLEDGHEREVLLGKATRLLPDFPIVDWRNAPVSRVFYRYRQGEDYEEEIAGRLRSGAVLARRTVAIRDRRLQRVEAPEGIFQSDADAPNGWRRLDAAGRSRLAGGQGAALRAHEVDGGWHRKLGTDAEGRVRRADKHLPDIAGLIDPAQFDLITRPSAGFLVVRGVAGSGKTTVALHRIAFLAYDDPAIDSAETLVVVFSTALRSYVSHVLPALHVRRVQVRTFHEWSAEQVKRLFPRLPRALREHTPAVVQRLKVHPALAIALERQVAHVPGPGTVEQATDDWASVLTQRPQLEAVLAEHAPGAFSAEEIGRACDWTRARHDELNGWWSGEEGVEAELDPEDLTLLLRAWQLRIGRLPGRGPGPLAYRHVAIDEVQDFSPLEVRVLLDCLDERRSVTLAGDTQQHLAVHGGFTSWTEFLGQLGQRGAAVTTLQVSYRCTRQIADFAFAVLGDLREETCAPETVRDGPPVELFRFTDHGACVAYLADALNELAAHEPLASVAVLTPSRELSALYTRGLATGEVPRLRQVVDQDFTFAPGVEVTEIEQVKGLEFDYVILIETSMASFPDTPAARRRLHVGATRAVHQLWLTSVATPSTLLRDALGSGRG